GLAISAPLLAVVGVIIAATSPGPVLFRQERVGLNGRRFRLYKLRTMRVSNEAFKLTMVDDARVTPVGKVLRKIKVDEIPQLWNVLKGDMSLVGPRPEVPQYVNLENSSWQLVLAVRPGMTDPLSLRLANEEKLLSERKGDCERFYLDALQPFKLRGYLQYLERRSWYSDIKVLLQTALVPFSPGSRPTPTAEDLNSQN
ncbi:MAG: sugar transferase, partial [Acidobacteriota bacterium]|nr:sugar transferase [Acidobacteriota bacterium]